MANVARFTWGLDPIQRRNVLTTEDLTSGAPAGVGGAVVKTSHYATDSDEPAWIQESSAPTDVTRYVSTLEGSMALTTSATGNVEMELIDLHGDVVGTLAVPDPAGEAPLTGGALELRAADEFGNAIKLPGAANPVKDRYSWLGGAQRSAEALGDVVLMGVRLYSPVTGRFLSVDPVDGGSASAYDYRPVATPREAPWLVSGRLGRVRPHAERRA